MFLIACSLVYFAVGSLRNTHLASSFPQYHFVILFSLVTLFRVFCDFSVQLYLAHDPSSSLVLYTVSVSEIGVLVARDFLSYSFRSILFHENLERFHGYAL